MKRFKTHKVTISVRFDAPLSPFEARHAIWNNLNNHVIYGDGKQKRGEDRMPEPYGVAHIRSNKAPMVMNTKLRRPKKKPAPSVERDPNTIDLFEGLQQ